MTVLSKYPKPTRAEEVKVLDNLRFCVFRDYSQKHHESWRVTYDGKLTTPCFNNRGAAYGYLEMLQKGRRKPEFV